MELRWYQRAAIDALYDYFTRATGDPLLVLPTGSGKSVIQAAFQQEVMARWPNQRILLLSHVKELLEQNAEKLLAFWPRRPVRTRKLAPPAKPWLSALPRRPHVPKLRLLNKPCFRSSPDWV